MWLKGYSICKQRTSSSIPNTGKKKKKDEEEEKKGERERGREGSRGERKRTMTEK
jgi:hypothetical protein